MHYDWFACACAEAFGEAQVAEDAATCSQATDDATHENMGDRMLPDGRLPLTTQAEISDGVYAAMSGGWHADYEKVMVFHFPWGAGGVCLPGAVDSRLADAARRLRELQACPGDADNPGRVAAVRKAAALVGVYGHVAVDSYAHGAGGFKGMPAISNSRRRWDKGPGRFLAALMPNRMAIGHSEYKTMPDTVGLKWRRDGKTLDNRLTFLHAAIGVWNALAPDHQRIVGHESALTYAPAPDLWYCPRCVTLLIGAAANDGATLRAACRKLYRELTGRELPDYRLPAADAPLWVDFQRAATARLREALA
jgi:hypothetical protein